jgi:hypothetical protein
MNPTLERSVIEGVAQEVLRGCGMETGESHEPPTALLDLHTDLLRANRLEQERRLHIGQQIGDVVAVNSVAFCPADPARCQRTVVSYVDGTRSMHSGGLPRGVGKLLAHMGVEQLPTPCDRHGGEKIKAILAT